MTDADGLVAAGWRGDETSEEVVEVEREGKGSLGSSRLKRPYFFQGW